MCFIFSLVDMRKDGFVPLMATYNPVHIHEMPDQLELEDFDFKIHEAMCKTNKEKM
jgi:hypothetical protein